MDAMVSQADSALKRHALLPWKIANFPGAPVINDKRVLFRSGGAMLTHFKLDESSEEFGAWDVGIFSIQTFLRNYCAKKISFVGLPDGVRIVTSISVINESRYMPEFRFNTPVFVLEFENHIKIWPFWDFVFGKNYSETIEIESKKLHITYDDYHGAMEIFTRFKRPYHKLVDSLQTFAKCKDGDMEFSRNQTTVSMDPYEGLTREERLKRGNGLVSIYEGLPL